MLNNLENLNKEIISCRRCPRLVAWREQVAITKRKAFSDCVYWGKPVPGFGDINGQILILGLAPGAHGSNRTGRMFTGDATGDFLFPALYKARYANQPNAYSIEDGLKLNNVFISAVCRCVPPSNKPTHEEITFCEFYLLNEIALMRSMKGIVALGKIAFDAGLKILSEGKGEAIKPHPKFGHSSLFFTDATDRPWLLTSYHPSRQNTQTGRLTTVMFDSIWEKTRILLKKSNS